jgi:hypothetical protein
MSRENQLWGAPHIHGELLKLGIEISETSVAKYMVPQAALANLAYLPEQSRPELGVHRLLHRADDPLPSAVRVSGVGA